AAMLRLLEDGAHRRKLRLFAVALCRRPSVWPLLGRNRECVEVAEQFADRLASAGELQEAEWRAGRCSVEEDYHHQRVRDELYLLEAGLHSGRPPDEARAGLTPEGASVLRHELRIRGERLMAAMLAHMATFEDLWTEEVAEHMPRYGDR